MLNAKDFGVPQNRERVFIVGHLGGVPERKVFPIGASNSKDIVQLNKPIHSNNRLYGQDGISPTLNTAQGGNRQPKVIDREKELHPTLDANYFKSYSNQRRMLAEGSRIRRLTPTECERLMGLPDDWTGEGTEGKMSDTQRYKLCGNGVVVNVVEEVVKRLYGL